MSRKSFLPLLAVVVVMWLLSWPVYAQRPQLRTPPNQFGRPSVYDLLQRPRGILPNFYENYRPQQQLQQNLRMQQNQLQRQGAAIRTMQNQWSSEQGGATLSPTGRGSRFMDYLHFYPGLGGNR